MATLANIRTLAAVRTYAQAEAKDAATQCPAAYSDYQKAVTIANSYMTFAGTALEITYVETVRQAILAARQTWYAAGCPGLEAAEIKTVQETEVPETGGSVQAGLGGSGIGTFLLVGAGVFGLLYLLDKGRKGKGKTSARRKTTRRKAAPRRRRASRRRR